MVGRDGDRAVQIGPGHAGACRCAAVVCRHGCHGDAAACRDGLQVVWMAYHPCACVVGAYADAPWGGRGDPDDVDGLVMGVAVMMVAHQHLNFLQGQVKVGHCLEQGKPAGLRILPSCAAP
jgi:hypothetical protein